MVADANKWDSMINLLMRADAPRVLTPASFGEWLSARGTGRERLTVTRALARAERAGLVDKVKHGIYLNLRASPQPQPDEAAGWIRKGAVVSLQRVLGQCGVLNNPTPRITCVLSKSRAVGMVEGDGEDGNRYLFQFSGMREDLIPAVTDDWAKDAYQPYAAALIATPEKALLDWIYLSGASPRWRMPPRQDIDLDELDKAKLARLASKMGLKAELALFCTGPVVGRAIGRNP